MLSAGFEPKSHACKYTPATRLPSSSASSRSTANLTLVSSDDQPLLYVPYPTDKQSAGTCPPICSHPSDDVLAVLFFQATNGDASYLVRLHS